MRRRMKSGGVRVMDVFQTIMEHLVVKFKGDVTGRVADPSNVFSDVTFGI